MTKPGEEFTTFRHCALNGRFMCSSERASVGGRGIRDEGAGAIISVELLIASVDD